MVKKTKRHMHWFSGEGEKAWTEVTNFKSNQLWIKGRRKFRPTNNTYKIIFYERSTFSLIWLNLKGVLFIMCKFLSSIRNADHLRAFGDFDMKSSTPNLWYLLLSRNSIMRKYFMSQRYIWKKGKVHKSYGEHKVFERSKTYTISNIFFGWLWW